MNAKVVGISFNATDNPKIGKLVPVELVHDSENKYSGRAIAVMFGDQLLGHIGEKNNPEHELVFNELPIDATISRCARLEEGETFAKFKTGEITSLEVEFELKSESENFVQSFNEDVKVDFKELEHEYWYEGEKLTGGTTYIKRWIKPFDKVMISGFVAESIGYPQKDVLGIWGGLGYASSLFGKALHMALEVYEKFKKIGQVMQEKKDLPNNKALPTHPFLRGIVQAFYKQDLDEEEGEILCEVLVTNVKLGLCGYIDRLHVIDREKKICRVKDYKFRIDSEKIDDNVKYLGQFADLPKNKISKDQLQLSFYGRLLELSGWTVLDPVAHVYEEEWKAFTFPNLKLDF